MTGTLVTRAEWGARPASGRGSTIRPEGITVHYNGPAFGGYPWAHGRCAQMVRATQAFHLDGRGWIDVAYSAMVCPHGAVFDGRGTRARTAAQGTNDGNTRSLALMFLAGEGEPITDAARSAARWWSADIAGVPLKWAHRDWHSTACPGSPLVFWKAAGFPEPGADAPGRPTPPAPAPAPPTPPPPTLPARPTLRRGDSGRMVGLLQFELGIVAPPFPRPDGNYGPATEAKVRGLQTMFRLSADGVAGPATWRVIDFLYSLKHGAPPT